MQRLVILGQDVVDLSCGNVDAKVSQFFENPALRDMSRVMLLEHEAVQSGTEMPVNSGWQLTADQFARRRLPGFQQIAGIACFDDQVLHHITIASDQLGTARQILGRNGNFLVDRQILGLRSFFGAGPLAVSAGDEGRLAQRAGFAVGCGLLWAALETSDFRFEGRDALRLFFNHLQQEADEGSFVFVAEVGNNLPPSRRLDLGRRLLIQACICIRGSAHGVNIGEPSLISCASSSEWIKFFPESILACRLFTIRELLRTYKNWMVPNTNAPMVRK